MLVVDTSVLIAVLIKEADGALFRDQIVASEATYFSAANLLEARMVLYGRNHDLPDDLDRLIFRLSIQIEPVTHQQSDIAFDAFRRFGKGTGHPAGLNFGDCFAYALAKERDLPLLFKGDDFIHTDVAAA